MSTRRYDTPVPHDHTVRTPGCFRCELSADEVADTAPTVTYAMLTAAVEADRAAADSGIRGEFDRMEAAIAAALAAAPAVTDEDPARFKESMYEHALEASRFAHFNEFEGATAHALAALACAAALAAQEVER